MLNQTTIYTTVVPLDKIRIPFLYQRRYSPKRADYIALNWDDNQMRPLFVSLREDGYYYVFDGQHTLHAWEKVKGHKPIECRVYTGLTEIEEADLFSKMNTNRKKLSVGEIVRAKNEAEDPFVSQYINMLERTNTPYSFSSGSRPGKLRCHDLLIKKTQVLGLETVSQALSLISENISPEIRNYSGQYILGLLAFMNVYKDQYNTKRLASTLNKYEPEKIMDAGKSYYLKLSKYAKTQLSSEDGGARYYAKAILDFYNKGLGKNKLDENLIICQKKLFPTI